MNVQEVKQLRQEMFDKSMALIEKKGADYNRDQQAGGDTLYNLRVAHLFGIVPHPNAGILVRLADKFMRLVSLAADPTRNPEVKDESVEDTVADIHNYVDYLLCFYRESRASDACGLADLIVERPVEQEEEWDDDECWTEDNLPCVLMADDDADVLVCAVGDRGYWFTDDSEPWEDPYTYEISEFDKPISFEQAARIVGGFDRLGACLDFVAEQVAHAA